MIEEKKDDWRVKHWLSYSKIYMRYYHLKERCENIKNKRYKNYWWRWIKCEWNSFEEFYNDMWSSYQEWLTIDRIDVNWNYCKENCRWITNKEQQNNKTNNKIIEYNWEKHTLAEWSTILNIKYNTLASRFYRWFNTQKAFNL